MQEKLKSCMKDIYEKNYQNKNALNRLQEM
jgi:hypothetical protein